MKINFVCRVFFAGILGIIPVSALAKPHSTEAPGERDKYIDMEFREEPWFNLAMFNPVEMEFKRTSLHPWNGSYWPTHKGMLAHRYRDEAFPDSGTWLTNYNYSRLNPPQSLVSAGRVNDLAPSEKYDLLMDDSTWSLTESMWQRGAKVRDTYGGVPGWFGICHGWSAASHIGTPEPILPVNVMSAAGRSITFYPSDIKALVSYLWAESNPPSVFVGNRCSQNPVRDEYGRVIDPKCLDNNPMTWHISILNRLGRDGDSMVFDSAAGGEVWNYSLDSYYFRYFNPMTMKPARYFDDAAVAVDQIVADPYKSHRAEGTRYIVGVMMQVFFPSATDPRRSPGAELLYKDTTFVYDLELDESMNIIGGEWHSENRPDFVWTFRRGAVARTAQDAKIHSSWDFVSPLPEDWAKAGREGSHKRKVLASVVNGLVERSKAPVETVDPVAPAMAAASVN